MSDNVEKINLSDSQDAEVNKKKESFSPLPGMIPIGSKVKIKRTILEGIVKDYHLSADKKSFTYMVEYSDEGVMHEKNFSHDQIEEIK